MYKLIVKTDGHPFATWHLKSQADVTAKIEETFDMMVEQDMFTYEVRVLRESYNEQ